jgi:pimeloyl-ACP methyl ester carboxylesterase
VKTQVAHLLHRSARYFESGSGRTLLLLHAFPLSADQWLPQLHRVPLGWRVIAPDRSRIPWHGAGL